MTDLSILTPIEKLTKDLRTAARTLGHDEARFLVDAYYKMQEDRIRSAHQVRSLAQETEDKPAEPHEVISWLFKQEQTLENQIRAALAAYADAQTLGVWCQSITGIGPVITAGLLSHIDIRLAPTAGHIWSFAGLNPDAKWQKGQKRPWNARLKTLCWKIGESFVKVSNNENDTYGKIYQQRKAMEQERNEGGRFADQAAASLDAKRYGADTQARKAYEAGQLPPARIHLRAERYAVKLFLSHYHEVAYFLHHHKLPPKPFVFDHIPGHVHLVPPPNLHLVPGLERARRRDGRA